MTVGEVVSSIQSIAAGSYLDIQPSTGAKWVIHNIYHDGDVQLEYYDGTFEYWSNGNNPADYLFIDAIAGS